MEEDMILDLEQESDAPEDWEPNSVFVRDGKGRLIELNIPDDEEVGENVAND